MGVLRGSVELVLRNSWLGLIMSHDAVFAVPHSET